MARSSDPEVAALTQQIRTLTAQARALADDISSTLCELDEFTAGVVEHRAVDRRRTNRPHAGAERRRG